MRRTPTALFALALALACSNRDSAPPPNGGSPKTPKTKDSDGLGADVERGIDKAAEGVRRAGERVGEDARRAADALERAGDRAQDKLDPTDTESAEARRVFVTRAREDLARIDEKLRELEQKGSTAGTRAQEDLRAARDRARVRIDELERDAGETWQQTKRDIDEALQKLRADIEARRSS